MRALLVVVLMVCAVGCGGASDAPSPVGRSELRAAFAAGGVPLRIFEDSRVEWGEEQVLDSVFVPGSPSDPRPTSVPIMIALFRDEDTAFDRAVWVKSMYPKNVTVAVHKNVSLVVPSAPAARREKLLSLLRSL